MWILPLYLHVNKKSDDDDDSMQKQSKTLPCFCQKFVRSFCIAKASNIFSAKNTTAIDFKSTVRLNEFLANNFVMLMML